MSATSEIHIVFHTQADDTYLGAFKCSYEELPKRVLDDSMLRMHIGFVQEHDFPDKTIEETSELIFRSTDPSEYAINWGSLDDFMGTSIDISEFIRMSY